MNRRQFNKSLLGLTGVGAGVALGAIPLSVLAAWPKEAFDAESMDAAKAILGGENAEVSDKISFTSPDIAEYGAVVPISITSGIPGTDQISMLVPANPAPFACSFEMKPNTGVSVGTRIKMGKTSELVAMVRAEGKMYMATSNEVKVTIGGCGG